MITTKEQQRSAFALQKVQNVFHIPVSKEIANFVVGTPTLILENGLGQSLAFLLAKQRDEHTKTCNILREWLGKDIAELQAADNFTFLSKLAALDQQKYLRAQQEALALLQWLKRYARAFQKPDDKEKQS